MKENGNSSKDAWRPPSDGRPPHPWEDVALAQWDDWRWQLSHSLSTAEDFARVIHLTPCEMEGLSQSRGFPVRVTPYFASLIDADNPSCPLRRQVIPTGQEMDLSAADLVDSLGEDAHSPVPGLVHRYPDRVLMLVIAQCASICRFCTRNRMVGDCQIQFSRETYQRQIDYIAATPQVRDVLLSGGDPLILPPTVLEGLLQALRAIPHVEVIRIGTRAPIFLPQRITDDLVTMLRGYHPLWMNVHVNHPREITPLAEEAFARLADAGIPLGSQTVLLAGINDCPNIIKAMVHKLVVNRVRPYYLYQCDLVRGAGHFRTPVAKGVEIVESLRGHTSGFAVPTFVIDAPEGGGKVPVGPQYLLSMSESQVVVRNYEGLVSTYAEPNQYTPHSSEQCPYCRSRHAEVLQEGIAGLLSGRGRTIAPEGWDAADSRSAASAVHHQQGDVRLSPSFKLTGGDNGRGESEMDPLAQQVEVTADPQSMAPTIGPWKGKRREVRSTMRVALVCNLKKNMAVRLNAPPDALAEYDSEETAQALQDALRAGGHTVTVLEGDATLLDTVRWAAPDICFNIAEGIHGDAREAQVPALLEMLGIPYTGSRVLSQAISLDKAVAKRLWRDAGLPTAPFQVLRSGEEDLDPLLIYPLFVKPLQEGTGMGINGRSVVHDEAALRRQARWVIETYQQPALIEQYLPGREFTVGLIGNQGRRGPGRLAHLYDDQGYHVFPLLEIDPSVGVGQGLYNAASKSYSPGEDGAPLYLCPAEVPPELETELKHLAVQAFEAIGALDVSRVDFRVGQDGRPHLLEINTLPGLNPRVSDLCIMAHAEGLPYNDLINEILGLALERYDREKVLAGALVGGAFGTASISPLFQPASAGAVLSTAEAT